MKAKWSQFLLSKFRKKKEALESEEPTEILEEEKEVILPSPEEDLSTVEVPEEEITRESQIEPIPPVQLPEVEETIVKYVSEGPKGEMISCEFCGKELSSDIVFCLRCGNKLKK